MPVMDGMDFLFRLRQNQQFDRVPVIFQTARTSPEHIATGLAAGVFYYLQKPYASRILQALVEAALRDAAQWQALQSHCATLSKKSHDLCRALIRMRNSEFGFRTPAQARRVASLLASCFPDPSQVVIGILELMMNAVEHGNLGFSFSEKRKLLEQREWERAVQHRLCQEEYMEKEASVYVTKQGRNIELVIEDQGGGFDWKPFLSLNVERADAPNGRGIVLAKQDFDVIEFQKNGSRVVCRKTI